MACHAACLMTVGVLFCLLNTGTEALKQGKSFPYPYDWDRFPAAWFGGNSTDWESPDQLAEIGKYSMAILGWQHLITAVIFVRKHDHFGPSSIQPRSRRATQRKNH